MKSMAALLYVVTERNKFMKIKQKVEKNRTKIKQTYITGTIRTGF